MQTSITSPRYGRLLAGAAVASVALVSAASAQTVVHEWDFFIDTPNNNVLVGLSAPWAAYSAPTVADALSTAVFTNTAGSQPRARMLSNLGVDGVSRGFLLLGAGQSSGAIHETMIVTTTFASLDLAVNQLESISWDQSAYVPQGGNAAANAMNVHLLVQVGDSWYASENPFKNPTNGVAGNMGTAALAHSLDLGGVSGLGTTAWRSINFADGSPVSLGGSLVSTAIGTEISGIGFYVDFRGGTGTSAHDRRILIDNIQITASAVPEPASAAALLGLGALGTVLGARRRRR